jgi:hypothetical protein
MAARNPADPRRARLALPLLLLLLALVGPALAQENPAPLLSIGAGRLYTAEGWEIGFSKFALTPDSACYQKAGENRPHLVPASTVLRVEKQTGNEALKEAAFGGLCGLAGGLLGVWLAERTDKGLEPYLGSSEPTFDRGLATGMVAVLAVAGAGIGYAHGVGQKTYITVYEDPSLKRP